jgi:hypothetical protein
MFIFDKADFKLRKDKPGHYILIKGTIYQEDITIVNMYLLDIITANLIKKTIGHKSR